MKSMRIVAAAAATLIAPTLVASTVSADEGAESPTYTVTYRNVTDGQYLTPPVFAVHGQNVEVFHTSRPASPGVQAVAENGDVPALAAELAAALDATGLGISGVGGDAPIFPGDEISFEFSTDNTHLSVVSMLICTNDGFAGLDTWKLPVHDNQTKVTRLKGYDAGTEINTELHADLVPAPFCGGDGAGTGTTNPLLAQGGVILPHQGIRGVGDLDASFDWSGRVAEIVVTRNDPASD